MLKLALGCALAAFALIIGSAKIIVAAEISTLAVWLLAIAVVLVALFSREEANRAACS